VEDGACTGDYCTKCPTGDVCLIDCDLDQTIDETSQDKTCTACDLDCADSGCVRSTDCRLCEDDRCEDCATTYTGCESDGCISGAEKIGDADCECVAGSHYLPTDDVCGVCIDGCKECTSGSTCDECE
jgi:hypothetical protein